MSSSGKFLINTNKKSIKIIQKMKNYKTMTFLNSRYKSHFPNSQFSFMLTSQFRFHDFLQPKRCVDSRNFTKHKHCQTDCEIKVSPTTHSLVIGSALYVGWGWGKRGFYCVVTNNWLILVIFDEDMEWKLRYLPLDFSHKVIYHKFQENKHEIDQTNFVIDPTHGFQGP